MARRKDDCFLVRRVADRGIDKNISYSRAREDRFNRDRRFAAGGNEIGNRDPRDILKIKRLRQRVRDLETQQEIKRLRQRVLDLELQREMCKAETESNTVVWDEGIDGEQQPLSRHSQRFFEPIDQESVTDDEPVSSTIVWDESDDDSSTIIWDKSDDGEEASEDDLKTAIILDVFLRGEKLVEGGDMMAMNDDTVSNGGVMVVKGEAPVGSGGDEVTTGGNELCGDVDFVLKVPIKMLTIMKDLNGDAENFGSIMHLKIQNLENIMLSEFRDTNREGKSFNSLFTTERCNFKVGDFHMDKSFLIENGIYMPSLDDNLPRGSQALATQEHEMKVKLMSLNTCVGVIGQTNIASHNSGEFFTQDLKGPTKNKMVIVIQNLTSSVGNKQIKIGSVSFDDNRAGVLFDPGGFGTRQNSRTSFLRRREV